MKKYLLMLLAATTLSLGFTACGDDDDESSNPSTPEQTEQLINFEDYSTTIGSTYQSMLSKLGEPGMSFGSYYVYTYEQGNVQSLMIGVNPANNLVYQVMEVMAENVYEAKDIRAYFASKYKAYDPLISDFEDEETGEISKDTTYVYGNTEKMDDATLVITVDGNEAVTYTNPQNVPVEEEVSGLVGTTPEEAASFLGADINDLIEEYGDVFEDLGGMYMINVDESEYLMTFALMVEDNIVTSVILLFNEDISDEDIVNYYQSLGYTVQNTGVDEETGSDTYLFTNADEGIIISYSEGRAVVVKS